jgi:hypothetical protein
MPRRAAAIRKGHFVLWPERPGEERESNMRASSFSFELAMLKVNGINEFINDMILLTDCLLQV